MQRLLVSGSCSSRNDAFTTFVWERWSVVHLGNHSDVSGKRPVAANTHVVSLG